MSNAATTGYNHRLTIWFDTNKNNQTVAYYWAGRAFRMGLTEAQTAIANGTADQISGHPLR